MLVTGTGSVALFALPERRTSRSLPPPAMPAGAERVRALGASDTINYRAQADRGKIGAQRTGGFDRVMNAAGGSALDQSIMALAPGGEIAFMGLLTTPRRRLISSS
ncbi:zinc-binding dehydrogenase [Sphingomonas sp.]|uniref:zinc-binding dehydrogenase n=1 Tax=Sphingomonas sp. TaxID=28214 RepID=UPI003B006B27